MIYVGIDQSYSNTGLAVYRNLTPIALVSIKPKDNGRDRLFFFYDKFKEITLFLRSLGDEIIIGIEGFAFNKSYRAHQMGELCGVINLALRDFPLKRYAPLSHRKKALGKANFKGTYTEKKQQILDTVNRKFNLTLDDHNIADAVSIAQALRGDWFRVKHDPSGKQFGFFIKGISERDQEILLKYLE